MSKRSLLASFGAAMALFIGVGFGLAAGWRHVSPRDKASVVHVRLEQVLTQLSEMKKVQLELEAANARIEQRLREGEARLNQMQGDLAVLEPDSEAARRMRDDMLFEAASLEAWSNIKRRELLHEETRQYQVMYGRVLDEIARLAEAQGYDYVLLSDRSRDFNAQNTADSVAQMFQRKMLYGRPDRDVTSELVTRMNNAFNAGLNN